jgi:hypothetical protein
MNDLYYEDIEKHKSLLYGSTAHSLVSGSKTVCGMFGKQLKRVDDNYRAVYSEMTKQVEEHRKLQKV